MSTRNLAMCKIWISKWVKLISVYFILLIYLKLINIDNRRHQTQKKTLKNYPKNTYVLMYKYSYWALLIFTIILAFSLPFLYSWIMTNSENKSMISEEKVRSTISKLKDQFPSIQKSLLKKIGGAFLRLKSPGEPFILLLLHDDTNKKTTDCLASYTSIVAKQNIFTDTPKSLWMNASEWTQYSDKNDQDLLNEKVLKLFSFIFYIKKNMYTLYYKSLHKSHFIINQLLIFNFQIINIFIQVYSISILTTIYFTWKIKIL